MEFTTFAQSLTQLLFQQWEEHSPEWENILWGIKIVDQSTPQLGKPVPETATLLGMTVEHALMGSPAPAWKSEALQFFLQKVPNEHHNSWASLFFDYSPKAQKRWLEWAQTWPVEKQNACKIGILKLLTQRIPEGIHKEKSAAIKLLVPWFQSTPNTPEWVKTSGKVWETANEEHCENVALKAALQAKGDYKKDWKHVHALGALMAQFQITYPATGWKTFFERRRYSIHALDQISPSMVYFWTQCIEQLTSNTNIPKTTLAAGVAFWGKRFQDPRQTPEHQKQVDIIQKHVLDAVAHHPNFQAWESLAKIRPLMPTTIMAIINWSVQQSESIQRTMWWEVAELGDWMEPQTKKYLQSILETDLKALQKTQTPNEPNLLMTYREQFLKKAVSSHQNEILQKIDQHMQKWESTSAVLRTTLKKFFIHLHQEAKQEWSKKGKHELDPKQSLLLTQLEKTILSMDQGEGALMKTQPKIRM